MLKKFTELPAWLSYPRKIKGQLSTMHSEIISYACSHYHSGFQFRKDIVYALNLASYYVVSNDAKPKNWSISNPLENLPDVDADYMYELLGSLYINITSIEEWDIYEEGSEADLNSNIESATHITESNQSTSQPHNVVQETEFGIGRTSQASDLFLTPQLPTFDVSKPVEVGVRDNTKYVIYESLPLIPTRQCEVSCTTDVYRMSNEDLLNLYPDAVFYTRPAEMYTKLDGFEFDDILGLILPIKGFAHEQIVDNIIKYPHLEGIQRLGKLNGADKFVDFWKYIEIDGELHKTIDVWDSLEVSNLPKSRIIFSEYVIRRYLLERDINHVQHKYEMFGELRPYLTLFMPRDKYIQFGYKDTLDIAKKCVQSRVAYKKSRNPILRRLSEDV